MKGRHFYLEVKIRISNEGFDQDGGFIRTNKKKVLKAMFLLELEFLLESVGGPSKL